MSDIQWQMAPKGAVALRLGISDLASGKKWRQHGISTSAAMYHTINMHTNNNTQWRDYWHKVATAPRKCSSRFLPSFHCSVRPLDASEGYPAYIKPTPTITKGSRFVQPALLPQVLL